MGFLKFLTKKSIIDNISVLKWNELPKDVVIIDVRTPKEFYRGHIANAKNIDIYDNSFLQQINTLSKGKKYLVYCRTGLRSMIATKKMEKIGFQHIYNLRGGYISWLRNKKRI